MSVLNAERPKRANREFEPSPKRGAGRCGVGRWCVCVQVCIAVWLLHCHVTKQMRSRQVVMEKEVGWGHETGLFQCVI